MVPIKGEWTPFADKKEKLEYLRHWGLISPKSTKERPVMVVDGYFGAPEPCQVVGYKDDNWAVIQMDDGYHAIFGDYLAELQPDAMQKLPRGACFAEILSDYIVLDIETTGLNRHEHEIIEFAAIRYSYGKETARVHTLIKPSSPIPAKITELTGISGADVADAPTWSEVSETVVKFLGNTPLFGHNATTFDFPFLAEKLGMELENAKLDTLYMARKAFPYMPNCRLDYLKAVLDLAGGRSHRADSDAETTNALLWACLAPRRYESAMYNAYLDDKMTHQKKGRCKK